MESNSSSRERLRSFVQPVDAQERTGTAARSREPSGPLRRNSARICAPSGRVVGEPLSDLLVPGPRALEGGETPHRHLMERIVVRRDERGGVLVERPLVAQPLQLVEVERPEPAPEHEQMVPLDGPRRVELQVTDVLRDIEDRRALRSW